MGIIWLQPSMISLSVPTTIMVFQDSDSKVSKYSPTVTEDEERE